MKILYNLYDFTNLGGTEVIAYNKARFLSDVYGDEIVFVTTDASKGKSIFEATDKIQFVDLGINYYRNDSKPGILRFVSNMWLFNRHARRLKKQIKQIKPDVIISLGQREEYFLPLIHGKIPIVSECHMNFVYSLLERNTFFRRMQMRMKRFCKHRFDVFVVLTEKDRQNWKLDNAICIPNFCVLDEPKSFRSEHPHRVIAVGRLEYQKGYDFLLDIWEKVVDHVGRDVAWPLDIYGAGSLKSQIEKEIRTRDLEECIFLKGIEEDMTGIYESASIFVMPSRFEGFPLSLIEAMSFGLAPVVYDCPEGPAELLSGGAGCLIKMGEIDQFAQGVCELMMDDEKQKKTAWGAYQKSRQYSKEVIMERWQKLLVEISTKKKVG